jgi:hypothetical protein
MCTQRGVHIQDMKVHEQMFYESCLGKKEKYFSIHLMATGVPMHADFRGPEIACLDMNLNLRANFPSARLL